MDVTILDGAVVVNFLQPAAAKTFEEYALKIFIPFMNNQVQHVSRVDIVWDKYIQNSLKTQARKNVEKVSGEESVHLQMCQETGNSFCVKRETRRSCLLFL